MGEAEQAARLFQDHRDELGFVNVAQCREKDLWTIRRDGVVVAAALGNHCVRKPQTTLYDIAVDEMYRRRGLATTLVERMLEASPHDLVVAKCPADLPAVQFYARTGWSLVAVEDGKHRPLTVWEYTHD